MLKINTLRSKFLLYFIVISLAFILIFSFFVLRRVSEANHRLGERGFLRWAMNFKTVAEPNLVRYDGARLAAQANKILGENPGDFIVLFGAGGGAIHVQGPEWVRKEAAAIAQKTGETVRRLTLHSRPYYLVLLPVRASGGDALLGRILFGHSSEENLKVLAGLRRFIIVIAAGLLAVFILLIVLINRKLTRPLRLLKKGLERFSHGNFSHRLEIRSNDEFSYLGGQLNEMAEKIEAMMGELEVTRRNLEKQVATRTRELNESNQKLHVAMQELRDTQRHIIQSEKQKSLTAIVSGFAHEINNPLTGILGYVDLMAIRNDASPYIKEKLGSIQKQAVRIKNIIDQLNQLNPDQEQVKMEISLPNLLEKLVKVVSSRPENGGLTVLCDHFDQDIAIQGNHFALWQVFEGIVENAIEALHENQVANGRIVIDIKRSMDDRQAIVDIGDNGGGFRNLDKAFDPFYTTKSRTKKKGIGLTIAYNIIQEHQGNIVIKNNEFGGATVSVYLKILDKKANPTNASGG
ncbi:MAG: HAMP domain-containing protein [Candidatus Aminicenantes bacterium]|nr:HAMP domain-containing protein [Candidatus Aminicenantes bacterium]